MVLSSNIFQASKPFPAAVTARRKKIINIRDEFTKVFPGLLKNRKTQTIVKQTLENDAWYYKSHRVMDFAKWVYLNFKWV